MIKYLLTTKDGKVKSISDGKIEYDKEKFDLIEKEINEENIESSVAINIEKGKVKFHECKKKERKKIINQKINSCKNLDDIKNLLTKYLK